MIPQRALVIGVGLTGESCVRYLSGRTELFVTDTRIGQDAATTTSYENLKRQNELASFFLPQDIAKVVDSETVVYASPGIPLHDAIFEPIRECGSRLSCDVELFLDSVDVPAIGVTGTNGKSTTTDLLATMLRTQGFVAGGNIGTPVLDLLSNPARGYVIELSSFQLERMRPPELQSATILNISEDHIDHHRTFDDYASAKHRIYERCEIAVFNNNDPITVPTPKKRSIAVNGTNDWCVRSHEIVIAGESLRTAELQLVGAQNHFNIVTAAALAYLNGAKLSGLVDVARNYAGLPHRMQTVTEIDHVRYVNDSKATNVAATCAALESFGRNDGNVVLLAGGEGKGANFDALVEPFRSFVKAAVLFGRDANVIGAAVEGSTELAYADSLEIAVEQAHDVAEPGDVVLLSPACASFDMFSNFADRGIRFEHIVRAMAS